VWLIGFLFETIGDLQLASFQIDPTNAGRVLDRGLWRCTRHPNYFGDFCIWWGLFFIATNAGAAWTIFSPLLMSVLVMKVSGVSLLEQTITSRRPEYAAYPAADKRLLSSPTAPRNVSPPQNPAWATLGRPHCALALTGTPTHSDGH
jgi:steroid 5-alpha reductase family enzyme